MRISSKIVYAILLIIISFSCKKGVVEPKYSTEYVIVIVVDGARYSETWGDSSHQNIPHLANQLAESGVVNTQFYNNGPTYTLAGHTAITTGFYQEIDNSGNELPKYPSFLQYFNANQLRRTTLSWLITSKDKLEVLNNCQSIDYNNKFKPLTDCGINGLGSGYREDSMTFKALIKTFTECHPDIVLVNFKEPDCSAHNNSWDNYMHAIRLTDEYIFQIFKYIQSETYYAGKTTIFVTNDHGRHLDSISNGFVSHGDGCQGCRHVFLYAYGPDFKQGVVTNTHRELIDISATISELLQLNMENGNGKIMYELFK